MTIMIQRESFLPLDFQCEDASLLSEIISGRNQIIK